MTIFERALELVPEGAVIGLGSGRAASAFVRALGERVRADALHIRAVTTSHATATLAAQVGVPIVTLADAGELALTVDGADEVDPNLDLIKGYGRAMVREKVVAASSRQLLILVGKDKLVPRLGSRGKLPVEVIPFALSLCERRLGELGLTPVLWAREGQALTSDNGNYILDCKVGPIDEPAKLDAAIRAIPGVVGTGLFLGMTAAVLVGEDEDFHLVEERHQNM